MIKLKKLLSLFLCIAICSMLCISASAADTPKITISSADALPGNMVSIDINIDNNPGIMAMAFCVTYDNTSLEYIKHEDGIFSSFTYKDHNDKGHVSFVNVGNKDNTNNGCFLSITFKVKDNAKPGKHVITLANSNREKYGTKLHNSFSNSKQDFVIPAVTSGSINVAETCENAGHNYNAWEIIRENTCTDDGLKSHVCSRCNYTEEVVIPAAHAFEREWTIDKPATPEEDGIMSRHCTVCDAKTDEFTFSYEEVGDEEETPDDNTSNNDSSVEEPSTDSTTSNDTSSETNATNKPNIDNVAGEKVPLQEAEKFEDFPSDPYPEDNSSEAVSSEVVSSENSSTESDASSGDISVDTNTGSNSDQDDQTSFLKTPGGIILTVISILLSIAIIAMGVIIIIRKQKAG